MSKLAIIRLAQKAIIHYAQEHYGWGAKYHPDQLEKYEALMKAVKMLDEIGDAK